MMMNEDGLGINIWETIQNPKLSRPRDPLSTVHRFGYLDVVTDRRKAPLPATNVHFPAEAPNY